MRLLEGLFTSRAVREQRKQDQAAETRRKAWEEHSALQRHRERRERNETAKIQLRDMFVKGLVKRETERAEKEAREAAENLARLHGELREFGQDATIDSPKLDAINDLQILTGLEVKIDTVERQLISPEVNYDRNPLRAPIVRDEYNERIARTKSDLVVAKARKEDIEVEIGKKQIKDPYNKAFTRLTEIKNNLIPAYSKTAGKEYNPLRGGKSYALSAIHTDLTRLHR